MTRPVYCGVCGCAVRDPGRDFGRDGDHAPCRATLDRMEADLERERAATASDSSPRTVRW